MNDARQGKERQPDFAAKATAAGEQKLANPFLQRKIRWGLEVQQIFLIGAESPTVRLSYTSYLVPHSMAQGDDWSQVAKDLMDVFAM